MGKLFRLYIDESGDHTYYKYANPGYDIPSLRYLGLMGVAMERAVREQAHADLEDLKRRHFDYDPDTPIIFHRKEIIHKQGVFKNFKDQDKRDAFDDDLIHFLKGLDCILIIVVIDKKHHIDTYGMSAFPPYHFALTAMMERYCGYLNFWNSRGDILAEKRGKKEDRELENEYLKIYDGGTYFHKAPFFQRALTTKKMKTGSKMSNIAGLQIADLLAHPCTQELLFEKGRIPSLPSVFGRKIFASVKYKYNVQIHTGRASGYGKVFIG